MSKEFDNALVESELAPIKAQRRALEDRLQHPLKILSNGRKFAKSMRQIRQHSPTLRENSEKLDVDGKIRTLSALDVKVTAIQGKFPIEISVDPRIKFRQMEPSHSSCLRLLKTGRVQKETSVTSDRGFLLGFAVYQSTDCFKRSVTSIGRT